MSNTTSWSSSSPLLPPDANDHNNRMMVDDPTLTFSSSSSHYSYNTNEMMHLARIEAWSALERRCRSHPQEARQVDGGGGDDDVDDGWSPLHWVLSSTSGRAPGPPAKVVGGLLDANPDSRRWKDKRDGSTILHFYCRRGGCRSVEVLRQILRDDDDSSLATAVDARGRTALDDVCSTQGYPPSMDVVRELVRASPSAITRRSSINGQSPLSNMWKKALIMTRRKTLRLSDDDTEEETSVVGQESSPWWDIASFLLHAASLHQKGGGMDNIENASSHRDLKSLLFSSIVVDECPIEAFEAIIQRCPCPRELVMARDENNRLPLHATISDISNNPKRSRDMIKRLLDVWPGGAKVRDPMKKNGGAELPLFLAMEHGLLWNDGLEHIFRCHPDAVWGEDNHNNDLPPFMLSATSEVLSAHKERPLVTGSDHEENDHHLHQLTTIFELLRECPIII